MNTRAKIDRVAIGLGLTVFVGIKVDRHDDQSALAFRGAIDRMQEVIACHLVSGESDFLLELVLPDMAAYECLHIDHLLKIPGVRDIRSSFVIQRFKLDAPLPLNHLKDA